MPALALLAFQFLGLLWLAEMQESVRSFPVAGISGLGIKRQKREALLRGETVAISLTTSGCHWVGTVLGNPCCLGGGRSGNGWWKLRTEEEWTRITIRELDLGTH